MLLPGPFGIKQREKKAQGVCSGPLVGLRQLYIWKSVWASAVELVSCFSAFGHPWKLWLCGDIPPSQGPGTRAPRKGSRAFLSFQVHVVLCPFLSKELKDCGNKDEALKPKIKTSLGPWNESPVVARNTPLLSAAASGLGWPFAVVATVWGGDGGLCPFTGHEIAIVTAMAFRRKSGLLLIPKPRKFVQEPLHHFM